MDLNSYMSEHFKVTETLGHMMIVWKKYQLCQGRVWTAWSEIRFLNKKPKISLSRTEQLATGLEQKKENKTQPRRAEKLVEAHHELFQTIKTQGLNIFAIEDGDEWLFFDEKQAISVSIYTTNTSYDRVRLEIYKSLPFQSELEDVQRSFQHSFWPEHYSLEANKNKTSNEVSVVTVRPSNDPKSPFTNQEIKLRYDSFRDLENIHYTAQASKDFASLLKMIQENDFIGKIIFFHGDPGTGKTFLVKSLLGEIQDKYKAIIVTTPLQFMRNGGYEHILNEDEDSSYIFIFEDAEKLVASDARNSLPDEFSVLANNTSGIIGSGRNDLFLFTFNRHIEKIDSALIRECRCVANISVGMMDKDTLTNFKSKHGDLDISAPCSLSEAYSKLFSESIQSGEAKKIDDEIL